MDWCSGESIHLPPVLPGFNFISSVNAVNGLNRGYYMVARRYEFYFRVANIFYERARRVSKILFLPRENRIHIFKLPCNVLFII